MRRAELYEVKISQITIYEGQIEVARAVATERYICMTARDEAIAGPSDVIERIPVYRIRAHGRDRYIAIASDLRAILEAPFREQVEQARALTAELVSRIETFHLMPWWKRLLRAWQRGL